MAAEWTVITFPENVLQPPNESDSSLATIIHKENFIWKKSFSVKMTHKSKSV